MNKIYLIAFAFIFSSLICFGQNDYEKEYVEITPGIQYKAGGLHKFFLGEHWREAWTTPIKVEVLDLDKFAGGLDPFKRGGGFQTKSLRLKGKDGNIWKFRSMSKDPEKVLPKILRKTVVADVFQDQISSAYPLAALVAEPIISAVGILQAKPYLVLMPDDPKLGEFREDFGGEVGMIEIHPDVDEDVEREFEGADKIKSTLKLFERLAEKRKEKVDANEYLKARLIDIFLGDWDRHTDQWKWARFDEGDKSVWKPIPRDRDQVFAKWDGLGPRIAAYLVPQFVHFDYDYPQIEDITWSGRFIDRRFLTEITEQSWDSVTADIVAKLTDEVIEDAVSVLPKEQYQIVSEEIVSKLKSRRDLLTEYSKEYYELINEVVDIYGTNKDDVLEIKRIDDSKVYVHLYDLKKKSGRIKTHYEKIFDTSITEEIRVYLLDGDDSTAISGVTDTNPLIRVIAGDGKDILEDSSQVNGYLLSVLPIPSAEKKTEFYDSGKKTIVVSGPSTVYDDEKVSEPDDISAKYEPQLRDRSHDWLPSPVLSFNSSDGINIGMGVQQYSYNFRMDPYEYWFQTNVFYSSRPKSFSANFNAAFNSIIKGTTITIDALRSELLFTNYYGFGNETVYNEDLDKNEFYRIDEDKLLVKSAIHLNYFGEVSGNVGVEYSISKLELNNDELSNSFKSSYGLNSFKQLKIFAEFNIDKRDNEYFPLSGFYSNIRTSVYPKLMDVKETFFKVEGFAAQFFTLNSFTDFTFGIKGGGGIVIGDYPFSEAIFVGGSNDLRGYTRRRFSGDSGLYSQLEVRTYLFPLKIIVPGKFGIHTFVESGRVFDDIYTNSHKWHPSYGGGIWLSFVDHLISASFTAATSSETTELYFNLGMGF